MIGVLASLSLVVLGWSPEFDAHAADPLREMELQGSWRPAGALEDVVGWTVTGGRLVLKIPAGVKGEWSVVRTDPLPEDGWTIDLWYLKHGTDDPGCPRFELIAPEAGATSVYHSQELYGHIGWVRMTYDATTFVRSVCLNGLPAPRQSTEPKPLGPAAARFVFTEKGVCNRDRQVEIVSFTVGPYAPSDPPASAGLALRGWASPPDRERLAEAPEVLSALEALATDDAVALTARAQALAAILIREWATSGAVSAATWDRVCAFISADAQGNGAAVALLSPLALACADPGQRAAGTAWCDVVLDLLPEMGRRERYGPDPTIHRAALLDPVHAALVALAMRRLPTDFERWRDELCRQAPGVWVGLSQAAYGYGDAWPFAPAWTLPQMRQVSPNYARLLAEYLRDYGTDMDHFLPKREKALAFAAYKLARIDPAAAMELCGLITTAEVKAETLECMGEVMAGAERGDMDQLVERHLKQAIAEFKPGKRRDSPVDKMVRLAGWYAKRERKDEALAVLRDALGKLGSSDLTRFSDRYAVYGLLRDLGDPAADALWEETLQVATEVDAARDEPDQAGGTVYLSATGVVVRELLQRGEVDRAIELSGKLDPDLLQMSRSNCFAAIIRTLADTDLPRALSLLDELTFGNTRASTIASVCLKLARTDREKALSPIADLPDKQRKALEYRIAVAAGETPAPELVAARGEAIAAEIRAVAGVNAKWEACPAGLTDLAQLGPAEFLRFAPYMQTDKEVFAHALLRACVGWAGLSDDPIWRWYAQTDAAEYGSKVWAAGTLRYAIDGERALVAAHEKR